MEKTTESMVGNTDFITELKNEGRLGLFFDRSRARCNPIPITLNVTAYYNGIVSTIFDSMTHHLLQNKKSEFTNIADQDRLIEVSNQLASGACIATYFKLRALILTEFPDRYTSVYLKRPKTTTEDLPVVAPFAFAIQQLGAVNISDLSKPARYVPVLPPTGHRYGLPDNRVWNPKAYEQAVEFARRTFGFGFNVVDPKLKTGTAWWLLRQDYSKEEEIFKLKLPFPEVNYTSAMAVTHTLFLFKTDRSKRVLDPSNVIFDLTPCGDADYGYILRDPHSGINVTTFVSIDESAKEINNV